MNILLQSTDGVPVAPAGRSLRRLPWKAGRPALATVAGLFLVAVPAFAQTETPADRLARLIDNRDQLNITLQLADLDQDVPAAPVPNPKTTWMSGRPVQV